MGSAECTWDNVARRYVAFLEQTKNGQAKEKAPRLALVLAPLPETAIVQYVSRWIDPASPAGSYFGAHSVRLIRTLQLIPRGDSNSRILELGCYMQITPALRGLLGYGEVSGGYMGTAGGMAPFERDRRRRGRVSLQDRSLQLRVDRFPYPDDESFDTVICCELLEHLQRDPMHMMSEIHRVLKPNGTLVLTTPNSVSLRSLRSILTGSPPEPVQQVRDADLAAGNHARTGVYAERAPPIVRRFGLFDSVH